jgi:hypothetical protein
VVQGGDGGGVGEQAERVGAELLPGFGAPGAAEQVRYAGDPLQQPGGGVGVELGGQAGQPGVGIPGHTPLRARALRSSVSAPSGSVVMVRAATSFSS